MHDVANGNRALLSAPEQRLPGDFTNAHTNAPVRSQVFLRLNGAACPRIFGRAKAHVFGANPLYDALFRDHRIEVPLLLDPAGKTRLVRVSAQLYNTRDDYERLAAALLTLL
jgi:hypothetical protein